MTSYRTVDPCTDPAWDDLTSRSPLTSLFVSPPWLRAVIATYGFEARAELALNESGQPEAGIAYASLRDARGSRTVAFPFTDYCDPLVEDFDVWERLVEPILAHGYPLSVRVLRSTQPLSDTRFDSQGTARWHATRVSDDEEAQWKGLAGSARRNIRKARRSGVEVSRSSSLDDLHTFYEMHARVRKHKYGLLPQPWSFFEALHQEFQGGGLQVLLARHDGAVVGGVVLFAWNDTLYYKFNASELQQLDVRPNDLLAWEGLTVARELGLQWFDWGVSDEDQPGLIQYKQKFATDEGCVTTVRTDPAPETNPSPPAVIDAEFGSILAELTSLLTDERVPDDLTVRAGALLYRYFA